MKEIVNKKGQIELNSLAKEMAEKAFENSMNKKKVSPFQIKARESGLLYFGGKPDDITVIAAIINTN